MSAVKFFSQTPLICTGGNLSDIASACVCVCVKFLNKTINMHGSYNKQWRISKKKRFLPTKCCVEIMLVMFLLMRQHSLQVIIFVSLKVLQHVSKNLEES